MGKTNNYSNLKKEVRKYKYVYIVNKKYRVKIKKENIKYQNDFIYLETAIANRNNFLEKENKLHWLGVKEYLKLKLNHIDFWKRLKFLFSGNYKDLE